MIFVSVKRKQALAPLEKELNALIPPYQGLAQLLHAEGIDE